MMRSFKFKFIIALFLMILSTSIFMPFSALAIDKQYLAPDQFDDSSYNTFASTNVPGKNGSLGDLIKKMLGVILTIVRTIAVGWAILMAISIATKYMSASPQVKAQLKTDMPTYLVGAAILFGAAGIITLVQYFIEDTLK